MNEISMAMQKLSGSNYPTRLVIMMFSRRNCLAIMAESLDLCISGLAAAILGFTLPVRSYSIKHQHQSIGWLDPGDISVEISFLSCLQAETVCVPF